MGIVQEILLHLVLEVGASLQLLLQTLDFLGMRLIEEVSTRGLHSGVKCVAMRSVVMTHLVDRKDLGRVSAVNPRVVDRVPDAHAKVSGHLEASD